MEEYLQNLRSLRSQMNDIEEEAAKRSVEEQQQKTTIESLERDLDLVQSQTKQTNEVMAEMLKASAELSSEIAVKQNKIACLEAEWHTLSQSLELLQQEITSTLEKGEGQRLEYARIEEELYLKLDEQQKWLNSYTEETLVDEKSVKETLAKQTHENIQGDSTSSLHTEANLDSKGIDISEKQKDLVNKMESAKVRLHELEAKKSQLDFDISKSIQSLELWNKKMEAVPAALKEMNVNTLEEENRAILAEKTGELDFLQSLKDQISQLKGVSHVLKCECGTEYKIQLGDSSVDCI